MLTRILALITAITVLSGPVHAVHVIMTGGPALKKWEGLRVKADRHDNWWANFVAATRIRTQQIKSKEPNAKVIWIVYKPGYVTRAIDDKQPYVQWINELAKKYKANIVWVNTADQAIKALNKSPKGKNDLIESFYYFGHSNCYALMLDYGNEIMAVSKQWIHETDLPKINRSAFRPDADCWSYGCYTGVSMSHWWNKFLGIPLWGNTKSTLYAPVSSGNLPEGAGKWVNGR